MSNYKLKTVGSEPPWDEDLRGWLEKYIYEHPHHTIDVLSRSYYIGEPRPVLDDYMAGVLFLPVESGGRGADPTDSSVENSVRAFRESVEGTIRHGYANTFVETHTWFQLQRACSTAIEENVMVVVYGKPGVGKSRCLMEFATRHVTTAPVVLLCSRNITTCYFARRLARALKLEEHHATARLEDLVAEKLKRYPRPLFIDQANYLDEKALGLICYIWEVARVPVVLAGTKDLYDLFTTSRLTEGVRAQLSSRVALHYLLAELSLPEADVVLWRDGLRSQKKSAATVAFKLSVVRSFFEYLKAAGAVPLNPASTKLVSPPELPSEPAGRALSAKEVRYLLSGPDREKSEGARDCALMLVMLRLSLRVSEVCSLRASSVKWSHGRWTLRCKVKGGREEVWPLPKDVKGAIDHYLKLDRRRREMQRSGGGDAFLFQPHTNYRTLDFDKPLSARMAQKIVKKWADYSRLGDLSPHDLRRTAITRALESGLTYRQVQMMSKHKDPKTVMRYDHGRENLEQNAVNFLRYGEE